MRYALSATAAALLFAWTAPAAAQDPAEAGSDWSVTLGAIGLYVPEYEGAEEYELTGYPIVDVTWRDRLFLNSRDGAGAWLWNEGGFKLGASIGYALGRDDDDGRLLEGLGDVDGGVTANLLASYAIHGFDLSSRFTHQLTGDDTGFIVDLGVGYTFHFPRGVVVRSSLSTEYASGDYMEAYFGISPGQAARSGHPVYDTDAGFKSFGPELLVVYPLDPNWSIRGNVAYKRLLGDAADSPITEEENQFRLGLGVAYRF